MKKILVVGNGFDLAHNLPTRYSDFLYFMTLCVKELCPNWRSWGAWNDVNYFELEQSALDHILTNPAHNKEVKSIFDENIEHIKQFLDTSELNHFVNNDWLMYFICVYAFRQELEYEFRWIDIESELAIMLRNFNDLKNIHHKSIFNFLVPYRSGSDKSPKNFYFNTLRKHIQKLNNIPNDKFKSEMFQCLFEQLEKFNSLLNFYLSVVDKFYHETENRVFKFSGDIGDGFYVSHIISFNYTDISKIYNPKAEIYYVNGSLNDRHIVLGVENPFSAEDRSYLDDNAHWFFKNVQRILYDFQYRHHSWMNTKENTLYQNDDGKNICDSSNAVYIIGHSLALSDRYILLNIMESADNVTIFYYNDADKQSKITNLYRILGDDKFYRYINNDFSPKIILKSQNEIMLPS